MRTAFERGTQIAVGHTLPRTLELGVGWEI
jgi:hypothetical protein